MNDSYSIFLKQSVHEGILRLRGNRRKAIEKFIDYLSANPFDEGDFSEMDQGGRKVYCKVVRDFAITYYPDHPAREIKVIELVSTP